MLGIAGILRALLIDPNTVEAAARRRLHIAAPTFECTPFPIASSWPPNGLHLNAAGEPTKRLILSVADPTFTKPSISTGLKGFLRTTVARYVDDPISVLDFVKIHAHVLGGVRLGKSTNDRDLMIQSIMSIVGDDMTQWTRALQGIGIVTHRALLPVTTALRAAKTT